MCGKGRRVENKRSSRLPQNNSKKDLSPSIQDSYFRDFEAWYSLGASITVPTSGGLGEYIQKNLSRLTPRHTSVIAAVIVRKNLIECRGKEPIELRKLNTK